MVCAAFLAQADTYRAATKYADQVELRRDDVHCQSHEESHNDADVDWENEYDQHLLRWTTCTASPEQLVCTSPAKPCRGYRAAHERGQ